MAVGFTLLFSAHWAFSYFGLSCFEQVIFHLKVPLGGSDKAFLGNWIRNCVLKGLILAAIFTAPCFFPVYRKYFIIIAIVIAVASVVRATFKAGIVGYVISRHTYTQIYEEHYVDGRDVKITFPEKKRNLLLLHVESLETTYTSVENGGNYKADLLKEITDLAKENLNFSHQEALGGAHGVAGTGWTTGGLVGQSSGVPLCVLYTEPSFSEETPFLPGAYTLGDVLEKEGYEQELLIGSAAAFGGRKFYYDKHGNYKIFDLDEARAQGKIPPDYKEFWGYEDEKLFAIAKEELTRLSQTGKPFNLTMLTVDTHHPHGYVDRNYQNEYPEQLSNIIRGESRKVGEFMDWLKEQPFYEDTTVIIAGDHLSMAEEYISKTYDRHYVRTALNVFINSVAETTHNKNRLFTAFDMYPTILAAMGAEVEGGRLGFGVNLFSGEKTVPEQISLKKFDREVRKRSDFFSDRIFRGIEK